MGGLPLVDEDWHAIRQGIYKGVGRAEWEDMHCKYKELHQAVKFKKTEENKNAKTL